MTKNFVNYHILISHSPSCLNRDDMNMQKTALFGGKRRVRISSQSLKRAMRTGNYFKEHLGEMSIRTKRLSDLMELVVERFEGSYDRETIQETMNLLSGKKMEEGPTVENDSVAPWALEEIGWFCGQVKAAKEAGKDLKGIGKELKQDVAAMRQALEKGLDIALFGRMATSGLMNEVGKIDGSLAVAHALTTHEVDSDLDWFTAVDDLQELGSGHLNTQEFSSGVFYRYASLNLSQLQENLGGIERMRSLEIAAHLLHMIATEVPSAKQQSFAAFNAADMACISLSDQPISLANAFEKAVFAGKNGYIISSVDEFHHYWENIHRGYGLDEHCAEFSTLSKEEKEKIPKAIQVHETLDGLKAWLRSDGK